MNFDLISDLHLDHWNNFSELNFAGIGTSLICVVAGDVSSKKETTRDFLFQLSDHYEQVLFIEGNHEHNIDFTDIEDTNMWFENNLEKRDNLTYLWDSSFIINDTAFIGSNGWWTFDYLEPTISRLEQIDSFCVNENVPEHTAIDIWNHANENANFLANQVYEINKEKAINNIVVITHTLPLNTLLSDDFTALPNPGKWGKLYNSNMQQVIANDKHNKIKSWCFGHSHSELIDTTHNGIRFTSNPRGLPANNLHNCYYPKHIKL